MKANELRIGNLLKRGGVVVTIDARTIFDFAALGYQYEAIPLTPEWLVRFGFTKNDIIWTDGSISTDCFILGRYYVQFDEVQDPFFCKKDADTKNIFLANFKYVHQLQNLYFCLRGEELTTANPPVPPEPPQ